MEVLAPDRYKVEFTASGALRQKLQTLKELMRHRVPSGDYGTLVELAVDGLIEKTKKERFNIGRKPRNPDAPAATGPTETRHIPAHIQRAVHERDEGRCAFVSPETGRRCDSSDWVQIDHIEGFARTHEHSVEGLRLVCAQHNRYLAEVMYGRDRIDAAIALRRASSSIIAPNDPGSGHQVVTRFETGSDTAFCPSSH